MKLSIFVLLIIASVMHARELEMNAQTQQIKNELIHAPGEIIVGKTYRHYSGKLYTVIAIAHDSEDPALMRVVYQALYDCPTFGPNPIWVRPYAMFAENVVINGAEHPRFAQVD